MKKMDETIESIITPTIREPWGDFHHLLLKGLLIFKSSISSSTIRGEDPWEDLLLKCLLFKSISSELISRRPWKDLPHHLLELFLKPISEPLDRPYLNRVCKAWKDLKPPPPSLCFPALVYGPTICKFIKGGIDECEDYRFCYGSSHGWLIIRIRKDRPKRSKDPESHRYYLLNIDTKDTIQLPVLWMCAVLPHICLSSPPTHPDCIAVLFDITFQGFVFSKRGWNKWIKSDCKYPIYSNPGAEKDSIYYVFLFQTKFYACTYRGNIVAIDINVSSALLDFKSRAAAAAPPMTSLTVLPLNNSILPTDDDDEGCKRIDVSWTFSPTLGYTQVRYDWFLIESLGKLLAVRLYRREIHKEIINLDVLELDFKSMSWIKVKNLPGDQVLFISLFSSFSISGSEIGIHSNSSGGGGGGGNCIYVSDRTLGKIHKYDMHNQEMMVCTSYGYPPTVNIKMSLVYNRLWVKPTFL